MPLSAVKFTRAQLSLIALSLLGSLLLSLYYAAHQIVSGDQAQMLLKGFTAMIDGIYLPYGNEASTMGNVPGSLSSVIVGLPLSIWADPWAPMLTLIGLRLISILLFVDAIRLLISPKAAAAGAVIYALSPWFLYDSLLYNPAYLAFGAALFLNMLVRLRAEAELSGVKRALYSLLLVLALGFCLQMHFSWPVLALIAFILWLKHGIKISWFGIICGALLVALSLVPYVLETMVNEAIITNPEEYAKERYLGYGLTHVYPILKAWLYWLRFASLSITNKALIPGVGADAAMLQQFLYYGYLVLMQGIGALTLCVSAYCNYWLIFKHKSGFARQLTIASLAALTAAAALATLTLNYWQIIILFAFAQIPLLYWFDQKVHSLKPLMVLALIMVCMNLAAGFNSDKYNLQSDYQTQVEALCINHYQGKCPWTQP